MTGFRLIRRIAFFMALAAAQPALADWHEASSENFVIYADEKPDKLRRYSENLERYHAAMAYLTGRKIAPPSPSNRVVIFAVGDQRDIRKLSNSKSRNIAGFYVPRAGASRAFVQDLRDDKSGDYPSISTIVLLHEYAHHFLISASNFAMPRWFSEGAAEFFAATSFKRDGGVLIGRLAQHRAGEILYGDNLTVRELLEADLPAGRKRRRDNSFYSYSWLLYHYLTFSNERAGQLVDYQRNLMSGMDPLASGEAAFGDLSTLDRELKAYTRQRLLTFVLPPEKLQIGAIAIRPLTEGEAEMMPVVMRSQRGVAREEAEELVIEARAIAAKHPDDPGVLAALAEAEYDAGNDEAAIAAADAALARDPRRVNAYVQKGFALFRQAGEADDPALAFAEAMRPFERLNQLENDHPIPLIYYYQSFARRGERPDETARAALERASQLAPFDLGLKFNTALMLLSEGKIGLASDFLQPLAASPHGGGRLASNAQRLIEMLEKVPEGTAIGPGQLLGAESDTASDEPEEGEEPAEPAPAL
jgi:Flp pilus assembly protein TadD